MARRDRRSSLSTLFEIRGARWLVRGLLALALAFAAYRLTRGLLP